MSDLKAKIHQIRFPLRLCPRPRWGRLQRSPDPLVVFKGIILLRGGRGRGKGREGKGKKKRRGRKGEGNGRGEEGKGGFGGLIRVCLTYGILITDTHTHTHTHRPRYLRHAQQCVATTHSVRAMRLMIIISVYLPAARLQVQQQQTSAASSTRRNRPLQHSTRQSWTADSAPGVATWDVTLSTRKVVPCVRWPASGITVHSL